MHAVPNRGIPRDPAPRRSLCKAAAVTTVLRVITYPVRLFGCLRRALCREQAAAGYGLPYAICVIAIYGVSFSEGAGFRGFLPMEWVLMPGVFAVPMVVQYDFFLFLR